MKRMAAVCLAVLLLLCHAAKAENDNRFQFDFEDFILRINGSLSYRGGKSDGKPIFAFISSTAGITMSAVNAIWGSEQAELTPEAFTEEIRNNEASIYNQYGASGYTLLSYNVGNAVEKEYWGRKVLQSDAELLVRKNDTEIVLVQRAIRVTGSYGTYLFSLSAWSSDALEEASDTLVKAIQWK